VAGGGRGGPGRGGQGRDRRRAHHPLGPLGTGGADRARARSLRFPADATGLDEAGTLERERLLAALGRLARSRARSAELATHPGEAGDADLDRYRWGYVWDRELAALVDPAVRERVGEAGFRLGTYADLGEAA
jgi:hypothetical protein